MRQRKEEHIQKLARIYTAIDNRIEDVDLHVQKGFETKVSFCAIDENMKESFIYKIGYFLCSQNFLEDCFKDTAFQTMIKAAPLSSLDQKGLVFDPHGWNSLQELNCEKLLKDEYFAAELFKRSVHLRVNMLANADKLLTSSFANLEAGAYERMLATCNGPGQRAMAMMIGKVINYMIKKAALNQHALNRDNVAYTLKEIESIEFTLEAYLQAASQSDDYTHQQKILLEEALRKMQSSQQIALEMSKQANLELLEQVKTLDNDLSRQRELIRQLEKRHTEIPDEMLEDVMLTEDELRFIGQGFAELSDAMLQASIHNILATQSAILSLDNGSLSRFAPAE